MRPVSPDRRRSQRGMTLVELIVAFTILALTAMAVPLACTRVRREQEKELRLALREIHTAIDKYKDMADAGQLGQLNAAKEGYPESLEVLVEGVKVTGQGQPGQTAEGEKKVRFPPADSQGPVHQEHRLGSRGAPRTTRNRPRGVGKTYLPCTRRRWRKQLMERRIQSGNRKRAGFTIMELMVSMAIVLIVISVAVPLYQKSLTRARESVLRQNLFSLRTVIDEYNLR